MIVNNKIVPGKPIDTSTEASRPDKMLVELLKELQSRYDYLTESKAFLENAPLANEFQVTEEQGFNGLEQLRNMSRNNYAKLIVSATTDRLGMIGFRTAAAQDETGDEEAMIAFKSDDMSSRSIEAMGLACGYRTAYLVVDPLAKRQSVIPPTNGAVIHDRFGEPVAALTLIRDRILGYDLARLYLRDVDPETGEAKGPVTMYTASRELLQDAIGRRTEYGLTVTSYDTEVPLRRDILSQWEWWKSSRTIGVKRIPVTVLANKDRKSEFEDHTDVINRLNHMIFQRVVIATMQAFRQRAVIGNFPEKDPITGARIDYEELFASGPAQMWTLPEGTQMWESSPPNYQELLEAVKADTRDLASQTYTPMSYFSDAATNSAEGAALQRENYTSKIEDRRGRFEPKWVRHLSIYFETIGDTERSTVEQMEVIWKPAQVESLTTRVAAFASFKSNGAALSTALRETMGMTPGEINRAQSEIIEENLTRIVQSAMEQATPLERSSYGQTATTQTASSTNQTPSGGPK